MGRSFSGEPSQDGWGFLGWPFNTTRKGGDPKNTNSSEGFPVVSLYKVLMMRVFGFPQSPNTGKLIALFSFDPGGLVQHSTSPSSFRPVSGRSIRLSGSSSECITKSRGQRTSTHLSCSVAPFFPLFLVAAPLKWSKPQKGFPCFFQGH